MPWSVFAVVALFWKARRELLSLAKTRKGEFLTLGGFILPFIVLSTSHYKLPHYIFPLFPFMALMLAQMFVETSDKAILWAQRLMKSGIAIVVLLVGALAGVILFWVFPYQWGWALFSIPLFVGSLWALTLRDPVKAWIMSLTLIAVCLNTVLNFHFYPQLLTYQNGSALAPRAMEMGAHSQNTAFFKTSSHSFDFYMDTTIPVRSKPDQIQEGDRFIFTDEDGMKELMASATFSPDSIVEHDGYRVTLLNTRFLNPQTRNQTLKKTYLLIRNP
jgi:4-amino-4-deoxy-L-arabinose transferase-like glycosyltransferase